MLLLAGGTALYGVLGWATLAGLLEPGDEDEDRDALLQLLGYACRAWFLCSAVAGCIAARGVLQVSVHLRQLTARRLLKSAVPD